VGQRDQQRADREQAGERWREWGLALKEMRW
jgi:hypothetical protein